MNTQAEKSHEQKTQEVSNGEFVQQNSTSHSPPPPFEDNRPTSETQRNIQEMANNSPQVRQLKAFQKMANHSLQAEQQTQSKILDGHSSEQQAQPIQQKENNRGLSGDVKSGQQLNQPSPASKVPNNSAPIQRKVFINDAPYNPGGDDVSQEVKGAIDDEFLRYYESEQEAKDHLDNNQPGKVGLIKPRALWYRIPYLNDRFFVFGEYHSAVKGSQIKAASNITAPILDEARQGWTVEDLEEDELEESEDTGLDENASKLMRALEMWYMRVHHPPAAGGGGAAPTLPEIPQGAASTREETGGTKRLIVYGEGGEEEYWKPAGAAAAPPNTYDPDAAMHAAIRDLFEIVFADEIQTGNFSALPNGPKVAQSWGYFRNKSWEGQPAEENIKKHVSTYLYVAAKHKTSSEYARLDSTDYSDKIKTGDRSNWNADNYRDEFMFVRILEAKDGDFAFANMGNAHLERLKERFEAENIPYVLADDFFGSLSKDAVDTNQIAYDNSPKFRDNQRMVFWFKGAMRVYPNMQQTHIDDLEDRDFGEFILRGFISKWEQGAPGPAQGAHNMPILSQIMKDIKKIYPNSDGLLGDLSHAEFGEFLRTEKIARWESMGGD